MPPVASMQARFKFQQNVSDRSTSFQWLLDTHTTESDSTGTIDMVSQVLYFAQDGGILFCMNSLLKTAMFETTMYYSTKYSWFVPILDYPMTNLERYRRYVSLPL